METGTFVPDTYQDITAGNGCTCGFVPALRPMLADAGHIEMQSLQQERAPHLEHQKGN
jgi:hypothetical protein